MFKKKLLDFKKAVGDLVRSIPKGKVMTYFKI